MSEPKRHKRVPGEIIVDRRHHSRWPLEIDVTCNVDGLTINGVTLNLTTDGMYVRSDTPVSEGASAEVYFDLDGLKAKPHARGVVVRLAKRKEDVRGFAVHFEELDTAVRERIENLPSPPEAGA